jgi:methionyl-tRNA formyltransferase
VLATVARPIGGADTAEALLDQLAQDAATLLRAHLPALLEGSARPEPQDEGKVTLAPKLSKEMARLDPSRPAADLHRQVRGLHPWPGTELDLGGEILKVVGVGGIQPSPGPAGTLVWDKAGAWLCCGDGRALELLTLQRPGKPIQPALQALQPRGVSGRWEV